MVSVGIGRDPHDLRANRRTARQRAFQVLDDEHAGLLWTVTRHGGSFDPAQIDQADAELVRLRAEYDIA